MRACLIDQDFYCTEEKTMRSFASLMELLVSVASLTFAQYATAQEAPDALVKRISQEVIDAAKTDKNIQAGNQQHVRELVDAKILPHVDFDRMTSLTAGQGWKKATPDQQKQLSSEFRTLIIHTYSGAISKIRNQQIKLKPMRSDPNSTEVEVRTEVAQPNGEPLELDYRLEKKADGWKIYDMSVLGAWLVETYKSSFATEINKAGIEGLIKSLADKNKTLESNPTKAS
jgi:phospholipid transport system substrate-binding protein